MAKAGLPTRHDELQLQLDRLGEWADEPIFETFDGETESLRDVCELLYQDDQRVWLFKRTLCLEMLARCGNNNNIVECLIWADESTQDLLQSFFVDGRRVLASSTTSTDWKRNYRRWRGRPVFRVTETVRDSRESSVGEITVQVGLRVGDEATLHFVKEGKLLHEDSFQSSLGPFCIVLSGEIPPNASFEAPDYTSESIREALGEALRLVAEYIEQESFAPEVFTALLGDFQEHLNRVLHLDWEDWPVDAVESPLGIAPSLVARADLPTRYDELQLQLDRLGALADEPIFETDGDEAWSVQEVVEFLYERNQQIWLLAEEHRLTIFVRGDDPITQRSLLVGAENREVILMQHFLSDGEHVVIPTSARETWLQNYRRWQNRPEFVIAATNIRESSVGDITVRVGLAQGDETTIHFVKDGRLLHEDSFRSSLGPFYVVLSGEIPPNARFDEPDYMFGSIHKALGEALRLVVEHIEQKPFSLEVFCGLMDNFQHRFCRATRWRRSDWPSDVVESPLGVGFGFPAGGIGASRQQEIRMGLERLGELASEPILPVYSSDELNLSGALGSTGDEKLSFEGLFEQLYESDSPVRLVKLPGGLALEDDTAQPVKSPQIELTDQQRDLVWRFFRDPSRDVDRTDLESSDTAGADATDRREKDMKAEQNRRVWQSRSPFEWRARDVHRSSAAGFIIEIGESAHEGACEIYFVKDDKPLSLESINCGVGEVRVAIRGDIPPNESFDGPDFSSDRVRAATLEALRLIGGQLERRKVSAEVFTALLGDFQEQLNRVFHLDWKDWPDEAVESPLGIAPPLVARDDLPTRHDELQLQLDRLGEWADEPICETVDGQPGSLRDVCELLYQDDRKVWLMKGAMWLTVLTRPGNDVVERLIRADASVQDLLQSFFCDGRRVVDFSAASSEWKRNYRRWRKRPVFRVPLSQTKVVGESPLGDITVQVGLIVGDKTEIHFVKDRRLLHTASFRSSLGSFCVVVSGEIPPNTSFDRPDYTAESIRQALGEARRLIIEHLEQQQIRLDDKTKDVLWKFFRKAGASNSQNEPEKDQDFDRRDKTELLSRVANEQRRDQTDGQPTQREHHDGTDESASGPEPDAAAEEQRDHEPKSRTEPAPEVTAINETLFGRRLFEDLRGHAPSEILTRGEVFDDIDEIDVVDRCATAPVHVLGEGDHLVFDAAHPAIAAAVDRPDDPVARAFAVSAAFGELLDYDVEHGRVDWSHSKVVRLRREFLAAVSAKIGGEDNSPTIPA